MLCVIRLAIRLLTRGRRKTRSFPFWQLKAAFRCHGEFVWLIGWSSQIGIRKNYTTTFNCHESAVKFQSIFNEQSTCHSWHFNRTNQWKLGFSKVLYAMKNEIPMKFHGYFISYDHQRNFMFNEISMKKTSRHNNGTYQWIYNEKSMNRQLSWGIHIRTQCIARYIY